MKPRLFLRVGGYTFDGILKGKRAHFTTGGRLVSTSAMTPRDERERKVRDERKRRKIARLTNV